MGLVSACIPASDVLNDDSVYRLVSVADGHGSVHLPAMTVPVDDLLL